MVRLIRNVTGDFWCIQVEVQVLVKEQFFCCPNLDAVSLLEEETKMNLTKWWPNAKKVELMLR